MPTPKKGEKEEDFMGRCMIMMEEESPMMERDHKVAKCMGMWKQHKMSQSVLLDIVEEKKDGTK